MIILELCNIILAIDNNGNDLSKLNILAAFGVQELSDEAFLLHLEVNGGLVSLDLCKDVTRLDGIALLLEPLSDVTL